MTLAKLDALRTHQIELLFAKRETKRVYGESSPQYQTAERFYNTHEEIVLAALHEWWSQGCKES